MRKALVDGYLGILWLCCGFTLYSCLSSWFPGTYAFWNSWIGGAIIALLAGVLLQPAYAALMVAFCAEVESSH